MQRYGGLVDLSEYAISFHDISRLTCLLHSRLWFLARLSWPLCAAAFALCTGDMLLCGSVMLSCTQRPTELHLRDASVQRVSALLHI